MAYISFQPKDYFSTKLYTGNDTTQSITGVGFQPDWVWIKDRDAGNNHELFDAVRGATKRIYTDTTDAQDTNSNSLTSFDSDGFSVGSNNSNNDLNHNYASWNWLANGQGSSNTDGSINTTYTSANTTSGMSIIQYNGNGTAGATIGHGLGVAPKCVIIKRTDTTSNWIFGTGATGFTKFLYLNTTDAETTNSGTFNNTAPSSSVITLGSWNDVNNSSGTYIAYAFAQKPGFSSMGSYTGNGNADGVYQHLGFSASWLMIKRTDSTASWVIFDNKRLGYNVANYQLYANSSTSYGNNVLLDITSQGFKCRANHLDVNGSGASYIFMAFAEAPLVSSNGVPATAR